MESQRINVGCGRGHINLGECLTSTESFLCYFCHIFRNADTLQTTVGKSTCANFCNLCVRIERYRSHFLTSAESIKFDFLHRLGELECFKTLCIGKGVRLNGFQFATTCKIKIFEFFICRKCRLFNLLQFRTIRDGNFLQFLTFVKSTGKLSNRRRQNHLFQTSASPEHIAIKISNCRWFLKFNLFKIHHITERLNPDAVHTGRNNH